MYLTLYGLGQYENIFSLPVVGRGSPKVKIRHYLTNEFVSRPVNERSGEGLIVLLFSTSPVPPSQPPRQVLTSLVIKTTHTQTHTHTHKLIYISIRGANFTIYVSIYRNSRWPEKKEEKKKKKNSIEKKICLYFFNTFGKHIIILILK